jgi:hypothetical protein
LDLDIFQREDNEEQLNREIAYAIANIHGFRVSITPHQSFYLSNLIYYHFYVGWFIYAIPSF